MTFLDYLHENNSAQDWLELFYVYNEQNNYGFLIYGDFQAMIDQNWGDYESLSNALYRGMFDDLDKNSTYYIVDDCGRISTYNDQWAIVEEFAGYQVLANFAEENDLPIWQEYKEQMEEN